MLDRAEIFEVEEEMVGLVVVGDTFDNSISLNDVTGGLKSVVDFAREKSENNFSAVIQIVSAACMALHFKSLVKNFGHIPVPIVIGGPGTGKTTMAKLAMRSIYKAHPACSTSEHGNVVNQKSIR